MRLLRFIIIVLVVGLFIFWRINPALFSASLFRSKEATLGYISKHPLPSLPPQVKSAVDIQQKKLSKTIQAESRILTQKVAIETKKTIADIVQQGAESVTKLLITKTDDVLGIFATKPISEIVLSASSSIPEQNTYTTVVNYNTLDTKKIVVKPQQKNYFQFLNIPKRMCLYVNGTKYSVENNNYVVVQFPTSGTYLFSFDFCSSADKQLQEIVVE